MSLSPNAQTIETWCESRQKTHKSDVTLCSFLKLKSITEHDGFCFSNRTEMQLYILIKIFIHIPMLLIGCVVNLFTLTVLLRKPLRSNLMSLHFKPVFVWSASLWSCRLIHFTFYFTLHCLVLLLVAMATEKYISVYFPLKASIWISKKRTRNIILLLLLLWFILNGHNLMFRDVSVSNVDKGPFTSSDCDIAAIAATSLPNLIYCFGVVLLHWAFATATTTTFAVAGESLCDWFGSDVADTSL